MIDALDDETQASTNESIHLETARQYLQHLLNSESLTELLVCSSCSLGLRLTYIIAGSNALPAHRVFINPILRLRHIPNH